MSHFPCALKHKESQTAARALAKGSSRIAESALHPLIAEGPMFHRIQQYPLIDANGRWYRPRAYGDPQPDGTWEGWLVFFPIAGGTAIAPPAPETTQRTSEALAVWAAGLRPVYLEGALGRAIAVEKEPVVIAELAAAEYEALEDAAQLETAAAVKRVTADIDDVAATAALGDADRLRRARMAAEETLAATEETAATLEAHAHEQAARDARTVAAKAAARRRAAHAAETPPSRRKAAGGKKK